MQLTKCCGLFLGRRNKKQAQSRLQKRRDETRREAVKTRNEAEAVDDADDDVHDDAVVVDHNDVAEEASTALAKKERNTNTNKQLENLM